jgi:hypothetical protein
MAAEKDLSPRGTQINPSSFVETEIAPQSTVPSSDRSSGVVYLLRAGNDWKIGKTNDSVRRVREINLQLPEKAERVHEIATNDIDWLERHWHLHFDQKRKNGEWFRLDASDVAEFCEHSRFEITRSARAPNSTLNPPHKTTEEIP